MTAIGLGSSCALFPSLDGFASSVSLDSADADAAVSADATSAPEASFCQTLVPAADFCADFDEGDVKKGWDNASLVPDPFEVGGGTIGLDDDDCDGTHAMAGNIPAISGPTIKGEEATLVKTFDVTPGFSMIFQLRMRIDTGGPSPGTRGFGVMNASLGPSGEIGRIDVYRDANGNGLTYFEGVTPGARQAFPVLPSGTWIELTLLIKTIDPTIDGGAGGTATLVVDGTKVASVVLPGSFQSATVAWIEVGPSAGVGPLDAFRARYDDVRAYFQ
jgi:hypothetical protein